MNRNTSLFLALAYVVGLSACGERAEQKVQESEPATVAEESAAPEEPAVQPDELIWVFRASGSRQCEGGGMSLEESGARLSDNGVVVQESSCGMRTDRMYPAVCGGPTGEILLHLIEEGSLDATLELGFDPADQIKYEKGDCPKNNN